MNGAIAWFTRNGVAANLLMLFLVVGGIFALGTVRMEVFPELSADIISVAVPYPGASPEEVEEGICVPVEEEIYSLVGVKKVTSTAKEDIGAISVEVLPGEDTRQVLDDVKARVDAIDSFPEEAEEPIIEEVNLRKQVLNVAVSGDTDEVSLRRLGETVRDEIATLPGITQVELVAVRPYEISIEVSEEALRRYGLTLQQVADAVRARSIDLPGGTVKTEAGEVLLRTKGRAYRGLEFEAVPIVARADGSRLLLGDVARVVDGFQDTDQTVQFEGERAVLVQVYRVGDQSAVEIGETVAAYVAEAGRRMPPGVSLTIWQDNSKFLVERIETLVSNGRSGLLLVFLVLALFLRFRLAFWVTLGIPIAFLATVMVMPSLDASINMLSLFAFILVLGIVVDDAIVVGEAVFRKQREGLRGVEAAVEGAKEVAVPVTFAVLTTIAAFTPMLMLPGTTGRIWSIIPLVVIPALLFSLVESKLILPAHLAHSRDGRGTEGPRRGWAGLWSRFQSIFSRGLEVFAERFYGPVLAASLRQRYLTVAISIAVLLLTAGIVFGGYVKLAFFPPVQADNVVALLTMPQGTPAAATAEAVARIERAAMELRAELAAERPEGEPEPVRYMLASVGDQPFRADQDRNRGGVADAYQAAHLGEVNIELSSSEERTVTANEIAARWREKTGPIPDAVELSFTSSIFSVGKAIDVQLAGRDLAELRKAADRLKDELEAYPGVYDVSDSFRAGKREIVLGIRPGAEALGLSLADLARQVRQSFYGEEAQRIQRGRDEIKVMVRYPTEGRRSLEDLERMRIRTPAGDEVPFATVATAEYGRGYSSISRTDRRRTITVTADVDTSEANANETLDDLAARVLPDIVRESPGVVWEYGGERQEQQETLGGFARGGLLAMLAIYALMAIPFRSYLQPLIVMLAVPFGLVGAVIGHLILDLELSLLSMCGMVALAGVVVNDSLVLVDYVNRQVAEGTPLARAVRQAGVVRFRPILLTSLTTFAGLTPMILETSVQAAFLIPMAVSLGFGVVFSTAISLLIVPAGTLILDDLQRLPERVRAGRRGVAHETV